VLKKCGERWSLPFEASAYSKSLSPIKYNPSLPIPTPSLSPIDAFTYLSSLTVSLGMLLQPALSLSTEMRRPGDRKRQPGGVHNGRGVNLAGAVLVGLIVYCGYQLCRMLFPARFG